MDQMYKNKAPRNYLARLLREYRDVVFIFAAFLILFLAGSYFDAAERIHEFIAENETSELDEIVMSVFILFFGLFALLLMRTKRLKEEINRRGVIEQELEAQARKLKENEERLKSLVEYSHDLIIETSHDGKILFANRNHESQFGYSSSELIGTKIFDYIHPDDMDLATREFMSSVSNLTGTGNVVLRYRHKSGAWRWIESTGMPYITADGELKGVITSRDISEKKRTDEELSRAQRLESLGVLAGGIAHDFNNMLTIVLGSLGLARMNKLRDDETDKILDEAEAAINRATGLTRQLLTFARGGAPDKKNIYINGLLNDSVSFALSGSSILPRFFISDDLEKVDIDEGQIDQVINNIIINAKQAMPGGGEIRVAAANTVFRKGNAFNLPEGKYVKIEIQDHGAGIEEKDLHRIFDPFFTTKASGSGLGLATSYSIVRKHGGHITVDSAPGSGTTVSIYLQASTGPAPARERTVVRSARAGKGNILIMEDEEAVAAVLGEMTRRLGYSPVLTANSHTAVKCYRDSFESGNGFDAVILDLTIPGDIGGKKTLSLLQEIDPGVRAIITSGYFLDGPMSDYIEHGFKAYVRKPYNIADIGETLSYVVDGKGDWRRNSRGNRTA